MRIVLVGHARQFAGDTVTSFEVPTGYAKLPAVKAVEILKDMAMHGHADLVGTPYMAFLEVGTALSRLF